MNIIKQVIGIILANERHRRYEQQMKDINIKRSSAPMLGTQIKGRKQ